jgi:hypothetical protein
MSTKLTAQTCVGGLGLILCLAGCSPAASAPPTYTSASPAWSLAVPVGEAYQLNAPAVGSTQEGWAVVWADGPSLFFRQVGPDGTLTPPYALPLGTQTPWNPVLVPAHDRGWHLLWQDLDPWGDVQLFSARLQADGTLLRGPITVSQEPVSTVTAAPGDGESVIVIWADANPRPSLYGQHLDAQGRPAAGSPALIARNAGWPALNRTADGRWVLGWLALPDSPHSAPSERIATVLIASGPLPWASDADPVSVGRVDLSDTTEYVEAVQVGLDQNYGYLLVSLRSAATGQPRADVLVFPLNEGSPPPPQPVLAAITVPAEPPPAADLTTGFNTGPALALPADTDSTDTPEVLTGRATAVQGQFAVLPVALEAAGEIVVGYFQDGLMVGYQPITSGAQAVGTLGLWVDRDRHLSLAWANRPAADGGPAILLLSSTRPTLRQEAH